MNKILKDETIMANEQEEKSNSFNKNKDIFELKYKRIQEIKAPKKLLNTLNNKNKILNYINIPSKKLLNNSTPNFTKIFPKNKYLLPLNRNKKKELSQFPSISFTPFKASDDINLLGKNESFRYKKYLQKISNINNNKISLEKIEKNLFINKINTQKNLNIRQKILFQKNNSQKNIFNPLNKSFLNFSKTAKNTFKKNMSYNSISLNDIPQKSKDEIIKVHEIDLKLDELLKKNKKRENEKNQELKELNEKIKKQKFLQNLAKFYDNLPSLIIKRNIDKNDFKQNKPNKSRDFITNFSLIKKEKEEKNKIDILIKKNPIIKYLFLQKILNSLVRKIKILKEKNDDIEINSKIVPIINEEIEDFITYGYEFLPENLLKNKKIISPNDLLIDQQFIKTLMKTKSNIDNAINNKSKEISQIKYDFDMITDSGIKIYSKKNSNLMKKFLEAQEKQKKSRFLYKKHDLDKKDLEQFDNNDNNNNQEILINPPIEIKKEEIKNDIKEKTKEQTKEKNEEISKDKNIIEQNLNKNNKNKKNDSNNNESMLFQIFNVLFEDINHIDDKIKKDKLEYEKQNIMKHKEKFWQRVLSKTDTNDLLYYIKKGKREIKSGEKSRNKKRNKLYNKFKFISVEKRIIKSSKKYMEMNLNDNYTNYELVSLSRNNIRPKIFYNSIEKNKSKREQKDKIIIGKIKKLKKKKDVQDSNKNQKDENIPQTKFLLETIKENIISNLSNKSNNANLKNIEINEENEKKSSEIKEEESFTEKKEETENDNLSEEKKEDNNLKEEKKDLKIFIVRRKKIKINHENENEIERKNKKIIKRNKTKRAVKDNSYQEYLLKYENEIEAKKNSSILLNILNSEKQKSDKSKNSIKQDSSLFSKKESQEDIIKEKEKEKEKEKVREKEIKNRKPKVKVNFFFNEVENKSLEDIEKKKIELLYKFKHDIEYKIAMGEIKSSEFEKFEIFKKKIINLHHGSKNDDLAYYIRKMEEFFRSFQDEMENDEKKKLDEDRINQYLIQFQQNYNAKSFYKDLQQNKLFKVINFSEINHINTLNNINNIN